MLPNGSINHMIELPEVRTVGVYDEECEGFAELHVDIFSLRWHRARGQKEWVVPTAGQRDGERLRAIPEQMDDRLPVLHAHTNCRTLKTMTFRAGFCQNLKICRDLQHDCCNVNCQSAT